MHNHFLDKLVEHGRCKLGEISVAFHKLDKLVCFQLVGVPVLNLPLPFVYGRFPDALCKLLFIVPHIPAHALDNGKDSGFNLPAFWRISPPGFSDNGGRDRLCKSPAAHTAPAVLPPPEYLPVS